MVHELLERLEAHLVAHGFYSVMCNMRGSDPESIAAGLRHAGLAGLQGPTVSQVRLSRSPNTLRARMRASPQGWSGASCAVHALAVAARHMHLQQAVLLAPALRVTEWGGHTVVNAISP